MISILVTLDARYIPVLRVLLASLLHSNREETFALYLAYSSLTDEHLQSIAHGFDPQRLRLQPIVIADSALEGAPIEKRYPREMYYRLFAAKFLPETLDRILYLDPDIVVLNSIRPLYELDMGDNFFAAASHVKRSFQKFNNLRLEMPSGSAYVNSGV
ncbi:MAG: glycosyltransferase, partial [Pygmaiobacter sp.]